MRKIISKHKEEKKRRRNQFLVGGFLIFVMLISVVGYSFKKNYEEGEQKINYNGIKFEKESNLWNAKINGLNFYFAYNPNEVEELNNTLNNLNNYYNKPLYFYSKNSDAETEIYRNLFYYNQIVQRVQDACLEGEECNEDLPVKSCEENIIIIEESENNDVIQKQNCVFIKGKKEEIVKLVDSFLYNIIGVQ
jgi:hypothetical protein